MGSKDTPHNNTNRNERSLIPWLTLSLLPGMHSRLFNSLLETFTTPQRILSRGRETLIKAGLTPEVARRIELAGRGNLSDEAKSRLEQSLSWEKHAGHGILTLQCPQYPAFLAEIPDPPPVLYVKGNAGEFNLPMFAMVGSRNPSSGGRSNARRFAGELADAGFTIVSGLAQGIDYESHRGALDGGGRTIAVLGTGIDVVYPPPNRDMHERIAGEGALISEFIPGTPPVAKNFPRRNRIISGLSLGVLVVEATLRSGSMITARFALEQGREVFAIPGSIHNPAARGCHRLIREGAKLVQSVVDIYEEFSGYCEPGPQAPDESPESGNPQTEKMSSECRKVMTALGFDPMTIDSVVIQTGLDVQQATTALLDLELKGLIQKDSLGYVRSPA